MDPGRSLRKQTCILWINRIFARIGEKPLEKSSFAEAAEAAAAKQWKQLAANSLRRQQKQQQQLLSGGSGDVIISSSSSRNCGSGEQKFSGGSGKRFSSSMQRPQRRDLFGGCSSA